MIDTSLNKSYDAKPGQSVEYTPMPRGDYRVRVKEVDPWKEKIENVKVNQKDENGRTLKNEKGENITELVNNCKYYETMIKFEVVEEGEYKGRLVFHNISTHPNRDFSIPAVLYGLNVPKLLASEIQKIVGLSCIATINLEYYDKKITDKITGMITTEQRPVNRIKQFKALEPSTTNNTDSEMEDLGLR